MENNVPFTPTRGTLVFILMASMMMLMGGAAIAPALPLISEAFPDSSETAISLMITLPSLAIAITGFAIGHLADKFGKVRTMLISLLAFTIAGISGFFLDTVNSILIGRFVVGVGIAGMSVAASALIAEYYTGIKREKVIALQTAAMGFGVLVLETMGGVLAGFGWRVPFLIYLIGLPILLGILFTAKEPAKRVAAPPIEGRIKSKGMIVAICYLTAFLTFMILFLLPTKLPYYLGELGHSSLISGIVLGFHGVIECIFCLLYRRISSRWDRITMISVGLLLIGIGLMTLYVSGMLLMIILSVGLMGVGIGLITPNLVSWLSSIVSSSNSGKVMSGYAVAVNFGEFASSLFAAAILVYVATYAGMFAVMGVITLIAFILFVALGLRLKNAEVAAEQNEKTPS